MFTVHLPYSYLINPFTPTPYCASYVPLFPCSHVLAGAGPRRRRSSFLFFVVLEWHWCGRPRRRATQLLFSTSVTVYVAWKKGG